MKVSHATAFLQMVFMLGSCHAGPKGMARKIDGSPDAAAKENLALLTTELMLPVSC